MVFGKREATFVGRTIYRVIILRGTSVCYILLEITHTHTRTHTYTGLNYQEIPRSLARELFVALSARRLHRDKNFCLVYLCLPTNAATNEREKKISRWKFLFWNSSHLCKEAGQKKGKKKRKKIRSESIPSTTIQCFLPSKRISHTRQTSLFLFKYAPSRFICCADKIGKDMRNWNFQLDLNFYSISRFEFARIRWKDKRNNVRSNWNFEQHRTCFASHNAIDRDWISTFPSGLSYKKEEKS